MIVQWGLVIVHLVSCACVNIYNVSQKCREDTETFLLELNKDKPSRYASMMYDAFGKLGSDVDGGNLDRPGSLSECLLVRGPSFAAQYCQLFLNQESTRFFVGICVPNSCDEEEVQTFVMYELLQKHESLLFPSSPFLIPFDPNQTLYVTQCLTEARPLALSTVIGLILCCALIAAPLVASACVAVGRWKERKEVAPVGEQKNTDRLLRSSSSQYGSLFSISLFKRKEGTTSVPEQEEKGDKEEANGWLQTLSLQNTADGLLTTEGRGGSYSSLNGIRVLSLLWIICGHSIHLSVFFNLDNRKRWKEKVDNNPLYIFTFSGPINLAVDTFLLLGGLLSAKSLLYSIEKAEDKLSLMLVARLLFKRIKRIQPLHVFIVCLIIGVFPIFPKGPFVLLVENQITNCNRYWWSNLLFINNLLPTSDTCAIWTWYLSVDFQFYITTPVLIFLYRLNKYCFYSVVALLLLGSSLTSSLLTAFLQLPVHQPTTLRPSRITPMLNSDFDDYFNYYYNKPYTRYSPYLLGILFGIYMKAKKSPILQHKWQVMVGWASSLVILALIVSLAYILREVPDKPSAAHALYQGLHRTLWAFAIAWIIVACEEGFGGIVSRILTLNLWIPLSNISFACYMIHPVIIILYNGQRETPMHYTDTNLFYLFCGYTTLSLLFGYLLTVLIERPYQFLKRRCN